MLKELVVNVHWFFCSRVKGVEFDAVKLWIVYFRLLFQLHFFIVFLLYSIYNSMLIRSAIFVKSASQLAECPVSDLPEFAMIGRSNVGKSSLINTIANNSKLSKISIKPGKTTLINFFLINGEWHLVDLP